MIRSTRSSVSTGLLLVGFSLLALRRFISEENLSVCRAVSHRGRAIGRCRLLCRRNIVDPNATHTGRRKNAAGTICSRRCVCGTLGLAGTGRCASAIPADMIKPTRAGSAKRRQKGSERYLKRSIMSIWGARPVPYRANSTKSFHFNGLGQLVEARDWPSCPLRRTKSETLPTTKEELPPYTLHPGGLRLPIALSYPINPQMRSPSPALSESCRDPAQPASGS